MGLLCGLQSEINNGVILNYGQLLGSSWTCVFTLPMAYTQASSMAVMCTFLANSNTYNRIRISTPRTTTVYASSESLSEMYCHFFVIGY